MPTPSAIKPVSYTHLDVYKRQDQFSSLHQNSYWRKPPVDCICCWDCCNYSFRCLDDSVRCFETENAGQPSFERRRSINFRQVIPYSCPDIPYRRALSILHLVPYDAFHKHTFCRIELWLLWILFLGVEPVTFLQPILASVSYTHLDVYKRQPPQQYLHI